MKFSDYKDHYIALIKLGAPILVGQLGMIVVAFADNIMVGRYSTEALASASFVNNVFNVAMFSCIGFTYGLTPLAGAMFSQERYGKIGAILRNGILVNLLFALVVAAVMGLLWFNLDRLGQPEELLPLIRPYYLLILVGLIPTALFNVFAQWLFAINNTSLPMWIILGSNLVNIAGNYLLIYGNLGCPEMGLMGAGISTLTSRIAGLVAVILFFMFARKFSRYRTGFSQSRIDKRNLSQVLRTSLPVALQMALESGSFSFAAVMAGWLGAVSLAAFQIIVITGTLGFCVYYSLGSAVSVLVSNRAGLGDNQGMRHVAFAGYHLMLTLAAISSLTFVFFGKDMIHAFTEDREVIAVTVTLIAPLVLYQLGDATQINFANALRGTSNVLPMTWIAFVSYVVVGIPATYLLGFPMKLGIFGIILSFSASLFLAAGLFLHFFLKSTRKKT